MPEAKAIATLRVNGRILEAEYSVCHDVIFKGTTNGKIEDQDAELREALKRHKSNRHSLDSPPSAE